MPHNILLVNPGTVEAIGMNAAMALGAKGFENGFIPESKDILWHSKLLDHGKEEVIGSPRPRAPATIPTSARSPATISSCAA